MGCEGTRGDEGAQGCAPRPACWPLLEIKIQPAFLVYRVVFGPGVLQFSHF